MMMKIDQPSSWWRSKVVYPVKRVWLAVIARVKARKSGGRAILELRNDVRSCGYRDVEVMWEMLRRSDADSLSAAVQEAEEAKRKLDGAEFWRVFVTVPSNNGGHCHRRRVPAVAVASRDVGGGF